MLGFDALGKLALGQLPEIFTNFFASLWPQPQPKNRVPDSFSGFIFVPEVTPVVFGSFSQPTQAKTQSQTFVNFPLTATTTPSSLVFASFPSQVLTKKTDVNVQTYASFRILRPDAATPSSLVFTKFSEPSFSKIRQQSNTNSSFFVAPTAAVVSINFSKFDLVQSKRQQQSFTGFVFVPFKVTPVFAQFAQPQVKGPVKEGSITLTQQTVVVVTQPYIFSEYSQPRFKSQAYLQPDVTNEPLRPDAATPGPISFNPFSEPSLKKTQQGFTSFISVPQVQTIVFTSFSQPQAARTVKEGNVSTSLASVFQSAVFGIFDQPFTKRILQQDQSFVNFPVVTVVTQPYVFSDFGQPQSKRVFDQPVNFTVNPPPVVVTTINFSGFSDFGVPRKSLYLQQDFSDVPVFIPIQTPEIFSIFSDFGIPKKTVFIQSDFLDSPIPPATQVYVFPQFSQPQLARGIREGWSNTLFRGFVQNYVFSSFDLPQTKHILQQDTSFVNLPVVVVQQQPYIFLPFDQPSFRSASQFDASVQFQIIPPPQVISVVTFTGFSDFVTRLYTSIRVDLGGISYDIFVPVTPVPDELLAAWKKNKYLWPNKTVKLKSSNVDEMELDPNTGELTVKFKGGREYIYNDVELKRAKGLEKAKSPGKYVNTKIRGKYPTIRTR